MARRGWRAGGLWAGLTGAAVLVGAAAAPAAPDVRAMDLEGHPRTLAQLAGRPAILILVRSDCGPCLVELRNIEGIKTAAGQARLVLLAVEDMDHARRFLLRAQLPHRDLWAAGAAPGDVLVKLNGEPPRMPLAVAFNRTGSICARHLGLLGTDRVRDWVRQCS
jgi:hypothetical protein